MYMSGPQLAELVSLGECVVVLERSLREGSAWEDIVVAGYIYTRWRDQVSTD
jgi:hypothetical protein